MQLLLGLICNLVFHNLSHCILPLTPYPAVDSSLLTFRQILIQGWVRHALRKMSTGPSGILSRDKFESSTLLGDKQWENRENSFHITALEEVNSLIRNYNSVAPYSVRKAYIDLQAELKRTYQVSWQIIREELTVRRTAALESTKREREADRALAARPDISAPDNLHEMKPSIGVWEWIRRWIYRLQQK
jgi:DnaJ homolog subfamily C member 28